MEGAAVSQIAGRNGVPCVILRAMSDNADESGYEVLVVKQFSITEYVKTATEIVANMIESLVTGKIKRPSGETHGGRLFWFCRQIHFWGQPRTRGGVPRHPAAQPVPGNA